MPGDFANTFKAARAETPSLPYQDFVQSRKVSALETMAAQLF